MLQEIAITIAPGKAEVLRKKLDETAATPEMWNKIKKESEIKDRDKLLSLFGDKKNG